MRFVLSYTTEKGDKGPSDIVALDRSATTREWTMVRPWKAQKSTPKEITQRRFLVHEATVLAARVPYLANREEAQS